MMFFDILDEWLLRNEQELSFTEIGKKVLTSCIKQDVR